MTETRIEVEGLTELRGRFARFPGKYQAATGKAMDAALLQTWGSVPSYPTPPQGSTYTRTGTLGRTLGSGYGGGRSGGQPDVLQKTLGPNYIEGVFGTNLNYAPFVIGEKTQAKHMTHWWTFATIRKRALPKIKKVFEVLAEELANYLAGKGI